MIAMKFTIKLDIGLSFLLPAALPQLVTDRETKLIVVGGPSDRTAIADAAPISEAERERVLDCRGFSLRSRTRATSSASDEASEGLSIMRTVVRRRGSRE